MKPQRDKTKKDGSPAIETCGFAAYPAEVAIWKEKAALRKWSFSQYVRLTLLSRDAMDEEAATHAAQTADRG